eukprot:TRINITY_DN104409_c0_g1_i1.p1 TRINITY_DN104409_c0_g1~~TRINITY_DN104409_c0_g1_i1.p1  ORF type:complete len:315 (+),score=10.36 TRINITY_DN104409_c0_g1_i1:84-1028(+)
MTPFRVLRPTRSTFLLLLFLISFFVWVSTMFVNVFLVSRISRKQSHLLQQDRLALRLVSAKKSETPAGTKPPNEQRIAAQPTVDTDGNQTDANAEPLVGKLNHPLPWRGRALFEMYNNQFSATENHVAVQWKQIERPLTQAEVTASVQMLLMKLHQFFTSVRCQFWLDWGTLLGSWRNHTIIPWDDDGDVGVLHSSLQKIVEKVVRFHEFGDEVAFVVKHLHHMTDIPFILVDTNTGVYVDVFAYQHNGENLTNTDLPLVDMVHNNHTVPFALVFPLSRCPLGDMLFPCPRDTKGYLMSTYGSLAVPEGQQPKK